LDIVITGAILLIFTEDKECSILIIPYFITHYYIVLTFAQSIQIIACSGTAQFVTVHSCTLLATHLATHLATAFLNHI